jgi:predicted transcriptional regulator
MNKLEMYVFVKRNEELDELGGYEFVKTVAKNFNLFKTEVETLDKARAASKEFTVYNEEFNKIIQENSEKDENGSPIVNKLPDGRKSYKIIDTPKVEKIVKDLEKKYKKAIDDNNDNVRRFNEELETEVTLSYATINEDDLPKDITGKQMKIINSMIEWNR